MFRASMQIPAGWRFATALKSASENGGRIEFVPVSLTTLVDSPVIAGEYCVRSRWTRSSRPVYANLVGDTAASIDIPADLTEKWKRLVQETDAMFGARHYSSYHFLLTLSDRVAHFGLEHHESNDSRVNENSLTAAELDRRRRARIRALVERQVPPSGGSGHAGLSAADGGRSPLGLRGPDPISGLPAGRAERHLERVILQGRLAQIAAYLDNEPGREWRPLADTTTAAQLL